MNKNNIRDDKDAKIVLFQTENETKEFQEKQEKHSKHLSVIWILVIILVFLFFCSLLFMVPYDMFFFTPAMILENVERRFSQLYLFFFGGTSSISITFYQYVAVALAGAALATCGAIFQGGFRNTLAGPSTMGVMSGGSLGCLIYLLVFSSAEPTIGYFNVDWAAYANRTFFDIYSQQIFTFLGCVGGVALVVGIATIAGRGKVSASAMILSGTVFSTVVSNFYMLIQYYMIAKDPNDTRIEILKYMMMGSFNNITTWKTLLMMGIPICVCLFILNLLGNKLNLLILSEDEAQTMGIDIRKYRYVVIIFGTILTAVVVAFCGRIGFLGFMIPLVGRKIAGPDMQKLLPTCMLLGAIMLIVIFDFAYFFMMTDYLNIFTSSVGAVVMVITLLKKRGGAQGGTLEEADPANMAKR